jgi:PDZ domain
MMIDLVDGRHRSNSYEHVSVGSSAMARTQPKASGSLTPDRSSRLPTSKTPHHRTNFPNAYKPPVPPGYEPPALRNNITEAHAASMRGPMDALTVISDIPFDQEDDRHKDSDSDSQPGRIAPAALFPPKPVSLHVAVSPETKPIVSPPTTGRSSSPSVGSGAHLSAPPTSVKATSSSESRCPSPMAPPMIRTTASYRSSSPILMIGSASPSRQSHQTANSPVKISPRTVSTLPFDERPGRVTPSPTAFVKHLTSRQPSPSRSSPLTTALLHAVDQPPFDEPPSFAGGYRMSPPRVSLPLARPYDDSYEDEPSALTGDFSLEKPRLPAVTITAPESNILSDNNNHTGKSMDKAVRYNLEPEESTDLEEDDDSLFDFEERNKRKSQNQSKSLSEESDDVSHGDHPTSLQQQPQVGWKRTPLPNAAATTYTNQKPEVLQSHGVSFGTNNIVHNYDPNGSLDADETIDNATIGGRSLNSLYTKSAESEVEDIIKDIFMIGSGEGTNPGRRKFKYNPRVKDRLEVQSRDEEGDATDDEVLFTDEEDDGDTGTHEDTTATFTDTTGLDTSAFDTTANEDSVSKELPLLNPPVAHSAEKTKVTKKVKSRTRGAIVDEKKEDDPLSGAWAFVESKINEVGAALGLETQVDTSSKPKSKQNSERSSRSVSSKEVNESSGWDLWQYLLGPAESAGENQESLQTDGGSSDADRDLEIGKSCSLEGDSRFVELAIQAAMSIHHLNGYEFNTSYEMDIMNDVRFSVVDLALPLGVIFQENEKGCWVNQILLEGSAAASKGGVKVGDQLAAVDGLSAIDMTVDEIARLIRVKKAVVELTFVRYVGPLRPITVQEEGYEISANESPLRKKLTWSPPISPNRQANKAKSSSATTNSPKGILKKNHKVLSKNKSDKSPTSVVPTKNVDSTKVDEPRKRFRLFGRRK